MVVRKLHFGYWDVLDYHLLSPLLFFTYIQIPFILNYNNLQTFEGADFGGNYST